jgi:hypothetical protein
MSASARFLAAPSRAIAGSLPQICGNLRFSSDMLLMQMPDLRELIRRGIKIA